MALLKRHYLEGVL